MQKGNNFRSEVSGAYSIGQTYSDMGAHCLVYKLSDRKTYEPRERQNKNTFQVCCSPLMQRSILLILSSLVKGQNATV